MRIVGLLTTVLGVGLIGGGCGRESAVRPTATTSQVSEQRQADELYQAAVSNLGRLAEFKNTDEMIEQVAVLLNEWQNLAEPQITTTPDALWSTLPEAVRGAQSPSEDASRRYTLDDVLALTEATWLRGIAQRAAIDPPTKALVNTLRGPQAKQLARAGQLFDWVVRNIALEAETTRPPRPAWQVLLAGRGTAVERAGVFMLLGRQQGLDVVGLSRSAEDDTAARPLLVGVVLGEASAPAEEVYVFDMVNGLAWPGPGAEGIATLAQAAADPAVLAQLDLSDDERYAWQPGDLTGLIAAVDISPAYLRPRLRALAANLTGTDRMVLHSNAAELIERLGQVPQVASVVAWAAPYEALAATGPTPAPLDLSQYVTPGDTTVFVKPFAALPKRLERGRISQLAGQATGEQSAASELQVARPSEDQIAASGVPAATAEAVHEAKHTASYWLGLLSYELGNYEAAADYFGKRTIQADPARRWAGAAHGNLGRSEEALGHTENAIKAYEADNSPQSYGSRWRAKRLKAQAEPQATVDPAARQTVAGRTAHG